jgi:hypothetical protein
MNLKSLLQFHLHCGENDIGSIDIFFSMFIVNTFRVDKALHFKRVIKIVNKYLRQMYGMEIKKVVKKAHIGKYHIKNNANGKLFKIVPFNTPEEELKAIQIPYILSYLL